MAKLTVEEQNGKIKCPLKGNAWHVAKPEERVRQNYIATLVNEYGYSLEQMSQELSVTGVRGTGNSRADIVIWKSKEDKDAGKTAFIVVECKAENVKIRVEDYYQGFNYASWAHAVFLLQRMKRKQNIFVLIRIFSLKSWRRLLLSLLHRM